MALVRKLYTTINQSHSVDLRSLADKSSYRCSGGIVAVRDIDRDVRAKCGDPLEIGSGANRVKA